MIRGATPAAAAATTRALGVNPWRLAAASDSDRAAGFYDARQLGERSQRGVRTRVFIGAEQNGVPFSLRDRNWHDFLYKKSGAHRRSRTLLASQGEGILIFARNVELLRDNLRGFRHRFDTVLCFHEGIDEAPADGRIFDLRRAGKSRVCFAHHEGGAGHALDAAGYDEFSLAALNRARSGRHRVHAGTAKPICGGSWRFFRKPSEQQGHAADVTVVFSSLIRATVDDIVHRIPIDSGIALDEGLDGNGCQIIRANRR
jgi:hypothetical protein